MKQDYKKGETIYDQTFKTHRNQTYSRWWAWTPHHGGGQYADFSIFYLWICRSKKLSRSKIYSPEQYPQSCRPTPEAGSAGERWSSHCDRQRYGGNYNNAFNPSWSRWSFSVPGLFIWRYARFPHQRFCDIGNLIRFHRRWRPGFLEKQIAVQHQSCLCWDHN